MYEFVVLVAQSYQFVCFLLLALLRLLLLFGLLAVFHNYLVNVLFYLFLQLFLRQKHILFSHILLLAHSLFLLYRRHIIYNFLVQNLLQLIAKFVDVVHLHRFGQFEFLFAVNFLFLLHLLLPHTLNSWEKVF